MSLEDDFLAVLQGSDILTDLLPGGMYSAITVGGEISRQLTPDAFDGNSELQPCALVKIGVETPRGPYRDSVQTPVQIFFYQRYASAEIDNAMTVSFALLNYAKIGEGTWRVEYESGAWNQTDDVLNANMHILRFNAIRIRQPYGGS